MEDERRERGGGSEERGLRERGVDRGRKGGRQGGGNGG